MNFLLFALVFLNTDNIVLCVVLSGSVVVFGDVIWSHANVFIRESRVVYENVYY